LLNFDSSLTDALTSHSTEAFWVLKLYYNAEGSSDFIGVSDQDRVDGSDTYYGIVSSWGSLSQSLDFFNFTTSTGNMSVKLINTDNTIDGGRFSDLFSTKNFANRKWELFLNTSQAGTYDTSARMIGSGIISGDIKYDPKSISLTLLDYSSKYHKQLPTNVVDSSTYSNAPEKNINKPIPMSYGDFHDKTGIGTIPTSGAEFDRHFTKSKFPAIVTDEWSSANQNVEAKPDSVAVHTLDTENVYIYSDEIYSACKSSNVTETEATPLITYKGNTWRAYIPLFDYDGYDVDNTIDGSFSTVETISSTAGSQSWIFFGIPKIPKLGELIDIKFMISYGNFSGSAPLAIWLVSISGGTPSLSWGTDDSSESKSVLSGYDTDEQSAWDFEGSGLITLKENVGTSSVEIRQIGIEIEYTPSQVFSKKITEQYEAIVPTERSVDTQFDRDSESVFETVIMTRTKMINTPSISDYIYFSGKGRKYDSFIDEDSRSQGYDENDLIENPVFMIEDVLRTELSKTSSEIDYALFDTSGNTTNGYLGDIYNDAVSDVKYAFSQYKFINSKDLINRLCKQILSWVFIGGDGKFKIKTLRRTGDYSSVDKTIDFNDMSLKSISRTSLGAVRNDITINYNQDYGQDQFISIANPTADATSTGTTVDGYKQTLKLELDADTLDSTTATQLADAYMTIFKDRKIILDFECKRPTYNDLEIGDIVTFSNWDSTIKLYGTAMGTDYYLITNISKKPNGCSVKAIKVS